MRIWCVCICMCASTRAICAYASDSASLGGREAFVCQPAQSKLCCPNCSAQTPAQLVVFFHPRHFPFLSDFPAAILCNFAVSSRREFLRWLWSERAGQSHRPLEIGARCHKGSWSNGEWWGLDVYFLMMLKGLNRMYIKIDLGAHVESWKYLGNYRCISRKPWLLVQSCHSMKGRIITQMMYFKPGKVQVCKVC